MCILQYYMYCVYSIVQYMYNVYAEHYRQSIESGEVKNRGIEITYCITVSNMYRGMRYTAERYIESERRQNKTR